MIPISPIQHFKVRRQAQVSYLQMQSLTQLYQPIIGNVAVSVYLTLSSLPMADGMWSYDMIHTQLMETLNMGIIQLNSEKRKLEAIGLLRSYRQLSSHTDVSLQNLVYDLQLPVDAYQFFSHPQLSTALCKAIGDQEFQMKVNLFQIEHLDAQDYSESTTNFESVYNYLLQGEDEEGPEWEDAGLFKEQTGHGDIDVTSTEFDYEKFMGYLIDLGMDHTNFTQTLKKYVLSCHQLFGLNEVEMLEVVKLSRHITTKHIQLDRLQHIAKQRYQKHSKHDTHAKSNSQSRPTPPPSQDTDIKSHYPSLLDKEIQLVTAFKHLPPEQLLDQLKKQQSGFVTSSENFYVKEIQQKSQLSPEVINALLYYIFIILKKENLYKKDLELYANRWQQAKIKDAGLAFLWMRKEQNKDYSSSSKKKSQGYYGKGSRHVEHEPVWMQPTDTKKMPDTQAAEESHMEKTNEDALIHRLSRLRKKGGDAHG